MKDIIIPSIHIFAIITEGLQGSPRLDRPVNHLKVHLRLPARQAGGERCWQTSSSSLKDTRADGAALCIQGLIVSV